MEKLKLIKLNSIKEKYKDILNKLKVEDGLLWFEEFIVNNDVVVNEELLNIHKENFNWLKGYCIRKSRNKKDWADFLLDKKYKTDYMLRMKLDVKRKNLEIVKKNKRKDIKVEKETIENKVIDNSKIIDEILKEAECQEWLKTLLSKVNKQITKQMKKEIIRINDNVCEKLYEEFVEKANSFKNIRERFLQTQYDKYEQEMKKYKTIRELF